MAMPPSPPIMADKVYVEDKPIVLPTLENGPTSIGDLWNSRDSTTVHGSNLLMTVPGIEHLKINVIEAADYTLRHVKSTSDRQKSLRVKGEISLEMTGGLVKVGGEATYDDSTVASLWEEELLCTYDLTTCSVEALPSIKETVNNAVMKSILNGTITATHVVVATQFGANVTASIRLKETKSNSKRDIKGDFIGKLILGQVTAAAKVYLEMLDSEVKDDLEKVIKLSSRPKMPVQPKTIAEMFGMVTTIHDEILKHEALKTIDKTVYGVPVRFTLAPIHQFIEVRVERLYLQFSDTALEAITAYLTFLKDFQELQFLHRKVLEAEPALKKILYDHENPLTSKIIETEEFYRTKAKAAYKTLGNLLKKYKVGTTDSVVMLDKITELEQVVSMTIVFEKVGDFVREGRDQLVKITNADIEDSHKIEIFTNALDEERWYQASKPIKILLRTGNTGISSYALATIYGLSKQLNNLGIKVGVSLPNISNNQNSLALKINGKEMIYSTAHSIQHVVQVLTVLVNEAGPITTRFFYIYASLVGIKLPFKENLDDLHDLIRNLQKPQSVTITESYLQTRELCFEPTGRTKLMINLECLDSALDSVKKHLFLQVIFGDSVEWVVGKWAFEEIQNHNDSPILFAFKDGRIFGVCCDIIDISHLHKALVVSGPEAEKYKQLIQPTQTNLERNGLHMNRVNFALNFASKLQPSIAVLGNIKAVKGLPGFEVTSEQNFASTHRTQVLLRAVISRNWKITYSKLTELILEEVDTSDDLLQALVNIPPDDTLRLVSTFKNLLEAQIPLYSLLSATLDNIRALGSQNEDITAFNNLIGAVTSQANCPQSLAEQLHLLSDVQDFSERAKKAIFQINSYLKTVISDPKLERISTYIRLVKATSESEREHIASKELLPRILSQIKIRDAEYPGAKAYLEQCIAASNYYGILHVLSAIQVHPSLYCAQNAFEKLTFVADTADLTNIMVTLGEANFTKEQYEAIIGTAKVTQLLKESSGCTLLLEKLRFWFCSEGVPIYFPGFLREKLEPLLKTDEVDEKQLYEDIEDTLMRFQRICQRDYLPDNFAQILTASLMNNEVLKNIFLESGALKYWDENSNHFVEAWDCKTVKAAYDKLLDWECTNQPSNSRDDNVNLPQFDTPSQFPHMEHEPTIRRKNLEGTIANRLLGQTLDVIFPADFLVLSNLISQPRPLDQFEVGYMKNLVPYILQRVKMWGLHVINPDNLSNYFKTKKAPTNNNKLDFKQAKKLNILRASPVSPNVVQKPEYKPISRIDLFSIFLAHCHPLVMQDILKLVLQFSTSLPLVVRDITKAGAPRFICLLSLLKSCTTKWEYCTGRVRYNQLFTSPYEMLVAIRVGSPKKKHGKSMHGKSSILNQVLSQRHGHMFSSFSNPGSEHGKPWTLDGSVEFCTLTQETCSPKLWYPTLQTHYSTGTERLLLLANLHGDALKYPETLELLKKFASKFIIFFNAMSIPELEEKYNEIESLLGDTWSDHLYHVLVDPTDGCQDMLPDRVIRTSELISDATSEPLRMVIQAAIQELEDQTGQQHERLPIEPSQTLYFAPNMTTRESSEFVNFVKTLGCRHVKSTMNLQKLNPKLQSYPQSLVRILNESPTLQELFVKFIRILRLPARERLLAISHVDKELSNLTAVEAITVRNRIQELREEKVRSMSLLHSIEADNIQNVIENKLDSAFEELDKICLGLEHIYREVGRIFAYYQYVALNTLSDLPDSAGELLVDGNAVEVLDGDLLDMDHAWFNAVCHSICRRYGPLKIFVVSIIGLQSSGKSTLLNALFACKFAVSVGRCTRGLYMRILFLDKELTRDLGVDAILVLDTEGLGSSEKLNDKERDMKDRQLATFTMSVSNLTLINVRDESISHGLVDILQVVIVAMARLEKADMSPDICLVHHLSERDSSKLMRGETEFANALQKAVVLTEKKDMKMGIRNSKSLQLLEQRIRKGNLARLFPLLKNGGTGNAPPSEIYHEAVTDLYTMILETIRTTKTTQTFHEWHEIIHSYWDEVSKQDLVLNFKNIKEIQDFIDRGTLIASAKSAIADVFRAHRDEFQKGLRTCFNQFLAANRANREWEKTKKEFLMNTDEALRMLPHGCPASCEKCTEAWEQRTTVFKSVEGKAWEQETQDTIIKHIQQSRRAILKQLNQMADALVVAHGTCAEFDDIVVKIVEKRRKDKRSYSDTELEEIIDETWNSVSRNVSTKMKVPPVARKILDEIAEEYKVQPEVVELVTANKLPMLNEIIAYSSILCSGYVNLKKINALQHDLAGISDGIIEKYSSKQYETRMIHDVSKQIELILCTFEKNVVKKKLLMEFKWRAAVFGLIKFTRVMQQNEKEWKEHNDPSYILEKRKDGYRKQIKIWLQLGFGYESEGNLIGENLLTAIRQLAQKQGDADQIKFVSGHSWLVSSENVRLSYFVDLAKEVLGGNQTRAIQHFLKPKSSITDWFNNSVNSLPTDKGKNGFVTTADSEFMRVLQAVRNIKNAVDLREFVTDYLTLVDGVEYNPQGSVNFESANERDTNLLIKAVISKLNDEKDMLFEEIKITPPSDHEKIQKILGCCEHCFWCGALCWGEFDHSKNQDDTRKHHACHQSAGLNGSINKTTTVLEVKSCDQRAENCTMFWKNCEEGMSWTRTKLHKDFENWTFTAHSKNIFTDMMKWFFANLHYKIAEATESQPASKRTMKELGFSDLPSIYHIVSVIESRIGKSQGNIIAIPTKREFNSVNRLLQYLY